MHLFLLVSDIIIQSTEEVEVVLSWVANLNSSSLISVGRFNMEYSMPLENTFLILSLEYVLSL